jgi:hypothetical protein
MVSIRDNIAAPSNSFHPVVRVPRAQEEEEEAGAERETGGRSCSCMATTTHTTIIAIAAPAPSTPASRSLLFASGTAVFHAACKTFLVCIPCLDERRVDSGAVGVRLQVLSREWIEGKRVLDIGCNSGAITIELAKQMHPRHVMGVDIDPALIHKARINLRSLAYKQHQQQQQQQHEGQPAQVPHEPAEDEQQGQAPKSKTDAAASDEGVGGEGKHGDLKPPLSCISHKGVEIRKARSLIPLSGYQGHSSLPPSLPPST